jgi:transposase InsO family protein
VLLPLRATVELGREENRRGLQNIVRSTKLFVLALELRDPQRVSRRRARPGPRIDLGAVHSLPQRLDTDAELGRDTRDHPVGLTVSRRISATIRTDRSRNSSGYFCDLRRAPLVEAMLHPRFQEHEHPRIPGRITSAVGTHVGAMCPIVPNALWALDFQFDTTVDGRTLKMLNVIDEYTRECPAIVVARSIDADAVVATLDPLTAERGAPGFVRFDNGPEFVAYAAPTGAASTRSPACSSTPGRRGRTHGSGPTHAR